MHENVLGFGDNSTPAAVFRRVGRYTYTFASATSVNVAIGASDLQLPPTATRQVIVIVPTEVPALTRVLVDGADAPVACTDQGLFIAIASAYCDTVGAFNITLTVVANSTESGSIEVYEADGILPLYKGDVVMQGPDKHTLPFVQPIGGFSLVGAMNTTDTATYTFSAGVTEDSDADAGDMRLASASNITPAAALTRNDITITPSGGTTAACAVGIYPEGHKGVKGGLTTSIQATVAGTSSVRPFAAIDTDGRDPGTWLLLVCTEDNNGAVTGVTLNGVAMTQRGVIAETGGDPDLHISAWSADYAPGDAKSFEVTFAGSLAGEQAAFFLCDLHDVGSFGTAGTAQGNAAGAAAPVDIAEGGLIVAVGIRGSDGVTITWTGVEEVIDQIASSEWRYGFGKRAQCAAETARTVTNTGSGAGRYATLVIPINP